jgi:capsular exopolysaccharide synthesis family protein
MSSEINNDYNSSEDNEESVNLREILEKYLAHWKFILLGVILFGILAFFYVQSKSYTYKSSASVLVIDDNSGGLSGSIDMFSDLGLGSNQANLYNELEVFKSRTLMHNVVCELELNKTVIQGNNILKPDVIFYKNAPINFYSQNNDSSGLIKSISFIVELINESSFTIEESVLYNQKNESSNDLGKQLFGKPVSTSMGNIVFDKSDFWKSDYEGEIFVLSYASIGKTVNDLRNKLTVETINKDASVLSIAIVGPIRERNNDIIDCLIRQHEKQTILEKNEITQTTSDFIAERMSIIEKELSKVEAIGEDFKVKNQLVDVEIDAQMYLEKGSMLEDAVTEANIQLKLAEFVNEYIKKGEGFDQLLPANLGIEDVSVASMIAEYNKLVLQKNTLIQTSSSKNPEVSILEGQLTSLSRSISESLKNLKSSLELQIQTLENQAGKYQTKMQNIPEYERTYRAIMRQQQIKESLYIYLLQKREENQIALASTMGSVQVVDSAFSEEFPIAPKKKVIFLGALLIGMLFPVGLIYLNDLVNNKVRSQEDIVKLNIPFAGRIPFNKGKQYIVHDGNDQNVLAEAFHMLRSNISFLLEKKNQDGNVIFVTSTIPGEGKTFVSLNLANTLTFNGKKTVIVGLDLRAPKIAEYLGLSYNRGVSNYLNDESMSIHDIIIHSNENKLVSYVTSGDISPNPSELLMRPRLGEMFAQLKQEFDYVIVDNPPIALVVDTLSIVNYADLIMYVVRANYLDKRALELVKALIDDGRLKNVATVLNAVTQNLGPNSYGYSYGYGYGYGYGNGQKMKKEKNGFKKFFKKF